MSDNNKTNKTGANIPVGSILKAIRLANSQSQRELARRSGVGNATISQIESGRINPTISLLKRVLDGIPISFSDFFGHEHLHEGKRVFFKSSQLHEIGKGDISFLQVGANLKNRAIQLIFETYASGASTGKNALQHEGEECGYILSGRLLVEVAGVSEVLKPGDAYYFKSTEPHRFSNPGSVECTLVSACTPPSF